MSRSRRIAVVGGGWAGLAAAVEATRLGHQVTLFEMARQTGGRARQVDLDGMALDNGQHILIGAYTQTLALMRLVGVPVAHALQRMPLRISYPDGHGLHLPAGHPAVAFARAVAGFQGWRWVDKAALLLTAARWVINRFECRPELTVAGLISHLPRAVRTDLLEPLCVAALNTPSKQASASVFLRVLKDALFSGSGSADLLLPRMSLSALLPDAATLWLTNAGACVSIGHRVMALQPSNTGWQVDGQEHDAVVLACTATEAARLAAPHAHEWAFIAEAIHYEPIVTVYAQSVGSRLPNPMLALHSSETAPAQFVFDLGSTHGLAGVFAFVISGAADCVAAGQVETTNAVLAQGAAALARHLRTRLSALHTVTEKRATFLCTPGLRRPTAQICSGVFAAGDYVSGPYPATLEGAVRSGQEAVRAIGRIP